MPSFQSARYILAITIDVWVDNSHLIQIVSSSPNQSLYPPDITWNMRQYSLVKYLKQSSVILSWWYLTFYQIFGSKRAVYDVWSMLTYFGPTSTNQVHCKSSESLVLFFFVLRCIVLSFFSLDWAEHTLIIGIPESWPMLPISFGPPARP